MLRKLVFVLFCCCITTVQAQNIRNRTLSEACILVVGSIKKDIKGISEIYLGEFKPDSKIGPVSNLVSIEPELRRVFKKSFEIEKIKVLENPGKLVMDLVFSEAEDPSSSLQYIALQITLREGAGNQIIKKIGYLKSKEADKGQEKVVVTNKPDVLKLLQVPFSAPKDATPVEFNKALKKQVDSISDGKNSKPEVYLKDNAVSADSNHLFEMELWKKLPGKTDQFLPVKPVLDSNGLPGCNFQKDDIYRVRLKNNAEFPVAVSLSIDGMSMFVVSEKKYQNKNGEPLHNFIIVDPKKTLFIHGWFKTPEKASEFMVGSYDQSVAAKVGKNQKEAVGVVTACFHAIAYGEQKFPSGEPKNPDIFSQSAFATAEGAAVKDNFELVDKPKIGTVRATISVRYLAN